MTEIKVYCDHCGKVLDAMSDYIDIEIEICHKTHKVDLCAKCFEKLNDIVEGFVKEITEGEG